MFAIASSATRLTCSPLATRRLIEGGFLSEPDQIWAADMVVADFAPAQAREVGFRSVRAGAVEAVGLAVVDPLHFETGVQRVP